jgi:hypothetical protein
MTSFDPQIGDPCHWQLWTDVEPCTVVARTAKTVTVRVNKTELAQPPVLVPGGFAAVVTEPAQWRILDELEARALTFTLRKGGVWKQTGSRTRERGNALYPGHRKFHDYGF